MELKSWKRGHVAPSERPSLEMPRESPGARYLQLRSPWSFLGQGKTVCSEIRFPAPVTLSLPNSCQKANHMPGERLRCLGS